MSTPIYNNNYRRNLKLYWQQYIPNWNIPKGYHVHHIKPQSVGGTHHPKNLIALHPDDHFTIHKLRGDRYINTGFLTITNQHGVNNPFYNKHHSDKTKQYLRTINLGRKHTKMTKQKISESSLGKHHHYFTGIYHTPYGPFESALQAGRNLGISQQSIINWCKKNNNKIISTKSVSRSSFLQKDHIGKSFNDIGFGFELI